jgi:hypothetical protein
MECVKCGFYIINTVNCCYDHFKRLIDDGEIWELFEEYDMQRSENIGYKYWKYLMSIQLFFKSAGLDLMLEFSSFKNFKKLIKNSDRGDDIFKYYKDMISEYFKYTYLSKKDNYFINRLYVVILMKKECWYLEI